MIWYTIPQAAERVGRKVDTIRQWVRDGDVAAPRNPIDGQRYILEAQLLDVERDKRRAQRVTRTAQPCGAMLR